MASKPMKRKAAVGTAVSLKQQPTSWLLNPDGSLVDWRDEDQVRAKVYAQWNEHWREADWTPEIGKGRRTTHLH